MLKIDARLRALMRTLHQTFGFKRLRPGQARIMRSVMARRDTLAIMPTGAGKSLCYQLPALHLPGVTLVVSPLISLMKDQSDKLAEAGVATTVVNSSLSRREERDALKQVAQHDSAIVFVTPERLAKPEFQELFKARDSRVALIVIDEAHCISQWGHDFRPAFLEIADAVTVLGRPPVLALTATATPEVIEDIVHALHLREPEIVVTDLFRDNLRYEVKQVTNDAEKLAALREATANNPGAGIIYAATVKEVEQVYHALANDGHAVRMYHGRMAAAARREAQDEFMSGGCRLMVATNAFGMGIDKPDIRLVVHHQFPGSLEAYYQESGRAGRDGEASNCLLLFDQRDRRVQQFFQMGRYPTLELADQIHRALAGADRPFDFDSLQEQLPGVGANKLQVALKMLLEEKLAARSRAGVYRLGKKEASEKSLAQAVVRYQAFAEHDKAALESMISYAQSARCRWRTILDYFKDSSSIERCAVCDNCRHPPRVEPLAPEAVALPTEVSPFVEGMAVKVKRFGVGEVISASLGEVEIKFADGKTRTFLPSAVKTVRRAVAGHSALATT
jgi:ATP-dependent DNA helicase RecQ